MSVCSEAFARSRYQRVLAASAKLLLVPAAVMLIVTAGAARAHHSFTATYFEDRNVTIEGTVLQFQFRNPHSFLHVQAPDENGEMHRWAVEWANPSQLTGQGVGAATLKPGDVVRITGAPGRDPADHRLVLRYLLRPADGYEYGNDPNETFD
jgi:hypothetical protein